MTTEQKTSGVSVRMPTLEAVLAAESVGPSNGSGLSHRSDGVDIGQRGGTRDSSASHRFGSNQIGGIAKGGPDDEMDETCRIIGTPAMGNPNQSGEHRKTENKNVEIARRLGRNDDKRNKQRDHRDKPHEQLSDRIRIAFLPDTELAAHPVDDDRDRHGYGGSDEGREGWKSIAEDIRGDGQRCPSNQPANGHRRRAIRQIIPPRISKRYGRIVCHV